MLMDRLAKGLGSPMTPCTDSVRQQQKKMQQVASRIDKYKAKKAGGITLNKLDMKKKNGNFLITCRRSWDLINFCD